MDLEDSCSDIDGERERWIELGNLGLRKSLLKCGVPQEKVSWIRTLLQQPEAEFEDLDTFLDVDDGVCIILATLGRASENNTNFGIPNLQSLDVGKAFVRYDGVNFTDLTVGQRELGALWVNLLRNPKITKLVIEFDWFEPSTKFLQFRQSDTEQTLIVHVEALVTLGRGRDKYGSYPVDTSLDLVADVFTTTKIRSLDVSYRLQQNVVIHREKLPARLADALRRNTCLESFRVQDVSHSARLGKLAGNLLAAFAENSEGSYHRPSPNRTIIVLSLDAISSSAVETLCSVLRTNKTLKTIRLRWSDFQPQEWAQKILDSLRDNDTLEHLDLTDSLGLSEEDVLDPLMNLLQFTSTGLKSISLEGTALKHKQSIINEELRVNREYRTSLLSEDKITPTTGRIVLCGFPFAGKTSICKTLQRQDSRFKGWKTFLQRNPRLRQLLWGKGVHQELHNRTRGFQVTFRGKPPDTTSIWDFGGQEEFYVLHDYLFPNAGNSCFLYVCSATHPPNDDGDRIVKEGRDIRVEFRFWMRFIASNFKHLKDEDGRTHCPHVTFVMTHLDSLHDGERRRFKGLAERVVADFRVEFGASLNISEKAVFIDARFPEPVENLFAGSERHLKEILANSKEYKVCSEVRDALQQELIKQPCRYIFDLKQVKKICARGSLRGQLQKLGGRGPQGQDLEQHFGAGLNIVLKYLNDVGDIIFVEGLNIVIIQVTWFGHEVLGHLIDPFQESRTKVGTGILGCFRETPEDTWTPYSENGFVRKSILDTFLKNSLKKISSNEANLSESLIDLMVHLDLCFEESPEDEGTPSPDPHFFFPALLDGNSNHVHASSSTTVLQWTLQLNAKRKSVCYVGRRLECSDELTFLTPGFFPRLQVVLANYFRSNNWLSAAHFFLSRNIIRFAHDGMEIIVEYSNIDYFVDVLVRSTKEFRKALQFIGDHVLQRIKDFCSSPQGCQGVNLVEAVIRPACVERLSPCEERRHHSVLVSYLKSKEPDYVHIWEKMPGASDCDSLADLLLGPPITMTSGEDLPNYRESSEVPAKFYFTIEDVGAIRTVEARLNTAKMIPVKLHILCDGTDTVEHHKVDGQRGRVLHILEDSESFNFPILTFASHILFEGTRYALGLVKVQTPKSLETFFENLPRTSVLDVDLNQLKVAANIKAESSPRDILDLLKKYSSVCPGSEWWKKFLNLQNFSDFVRDKCETGLGCAKSASTNFGHSAINENGSTFLYDFSRSALCSETFPSCQKCTVSL